MIPISKATAPMETAPKVHPLESVKTDVTVSKAFNFAVHSKVVGISVDSQVSKVSSISTPTQTSYTFSVVNTEGKIAQVEIVENAVTKELKVVDYGVVSQQASYTSTSTVNAKTGSTADVTTNPTQIKESKEYQKIIEFIAKGHTDFKPTVAVPLTQYAEKFQRSSTMTLVFTQESKTIQTTLQYDQRSATFTELDYKILETADVKTKAGSFKAVEHQTIEITPQTIKEEAKKNVLISEALKSA